MYHFFLFLICLRWCFTNSAFVISFLFLFWCANIKKYFLKKKNKYTDFLNIGLKLLKWYDLNAEIYLGEKQRILITFWVCEIVLQQTKSKTRQESLPEFCRKISKVRIIIQCRNRRSFTLLEGLLLFPERLIAQTAQQVMEDFGESVSRILFWNFKTKGVGNIQQLRFPAFVLMKKFPAIDGNFYRVLSRVLPMILMFPPKICIFLWIGFYSLCLKKIRGTLTKRLWIWVQKFVNLKIHNEICPIQGKLLAYEQGKVLDFLKSKKVKSGRQNYTIII